LQENSLSAANSKTRARRRTAKEHGPDPVDVHVGQRLRLARELAGLTQTEIGKQLRMSFQVVQKYEQGDIRVSASRLYQLAKLLGKPVSYFFEGLEHASPRKAAVEPEIGRHEIDLLRAYRAIAKPALRQRLLLLVRGIAERRAA
jgi:transcriptional regulator with XRE-family HTH domain